MTAPMTARKMNRKHNLLQATTTEQKQLQEMLQQMTTQEIELAANASYKYSTSRQSKKSKKNNSETYAKQYALRYLRAKDGDANKALQRMKATLKFRHEMDVEGLRTAFNAYHGNMDYAKRLEAEMQAKNVFVSGHDKDGRATYIFVPRNVQGHDAEWTIKQHIFTLEKAIASSKAEDQTVNAIVDCNGFSLQNAPPTNVGKAFMTTFRNHYAGSIEHIFLVDAPLSFRCLWKVFKPLVGEKTRNKIHFVQSKDNTLSKYYDASEAADWMMQGGEKNRDLDIQEYLYETKFDQSFDE